MRISSLNIYVKRRLGISFIYAVFIDNGMSTTLFNNYLHILDKGGQQENNKKST